ncbi:MAG: 50S ribosomal protein L21 [Bacteroidia bacterium]|jgi:large subunit ribosomal protein L21
MFAIVDIAGQQFKVSKDQTLYVHRLGAEEGTSVTFDKVLLTADGGNVKVGTPYIGAQVTAKVVAHLRGEKVLVFRKKRRKGYKRSIGHRQYLTQIQIESLG